MTPRRPPAPSSPRPRRPPSGLRALGVALVVAVVAAGCRLGADDAPPPVVVGGVTEPSTLHPVLARDEIAGQLIRNVLFAPLARLDSLGTPVPYAAAGWRFSEDSTRLTIHLRPGLRWHDGAAVTAEDVVLAYRWASHPDVGSTLAPYFERYESAQAVDTHTVRFVVRPGPALLYGWTELPPLPAHRLAGVAPGEVASHPFGTETVVGNGPYRLERWRRGDRMVFRRFEGARSLPGPLPALPTLIYRLLPSPTTLAAELARGSVDLYRKVAPTMLDRLTGASGVRVLRHSMPTYRALALNTRRPPFDDVRIRRAVDRAVDRPTLVAAGREGLGEPARGPLPPGHPALTGAGRAGPADPAGARRLLEDAGWRDTDGDGVRERGGEELSFTLLVNPSGPRRDVAVMIQAQLGRVGIDVDVAVRDPAQIGATLTGEERAFDAALIGWTRDPLFDPRPLFHCDHREGPYQFSGYCDPDLDRVLDGLAAAPPGRERRRWLGRLDAHLREAQPFVYLFFESRATAVRSSLRGVTVGPRGVFDGVTGWHFAGAAGR